MKKINEDIVTFSIHGSWIKVYVSQDLPKEPEGWVIPMQMDVT